VGFLAGLLPGIRELRAPFTIGCLWVAAFLVATQGRWPGLRKSDMVMAVQSVLSGLTSPERSAVAVAGIFLVGLLTSSIAEDAWSIFVRRFASSDPETAAVRGVLTRPHSEAVVLLGQALRHRLNSPSRYLTDLVSVDLVVAEFDLAAMHFSRESPDQFQEYDRLRSEASLRGGTAFPLLGLCLALASRATWPWAVCIVVGALCISSYLGWQGIRGQRAADARLAAAIYFGFASTPLLDDLNSAAGSLSRNATQADTTAWFIGFLYDRRRTADVDRLMMRLWHPSRRVTVWPQLVPALNELPSDVLEYLRRSFPDQLNYE
jgi:hypothetical protein